MSSATAAADRPPSSYFYYDPEAPPLDYQLKEPISEVEEAEEGVDKGMIAYRRGHFSKALEYFEEAARADPSCTDAHYWAGDMLCMLKRPEDAVPKFQAAYDADPTNACAMYRKGMALCDWQSYDEHEGKRSDMMNMMYIHTQNREEGNETPIVCDFPQGSPIAEALPCFKKAVEIDPKFTHALYEIGSMTALTGRRDEGDAWFDKALEVDPKYWKALDKKGDMRMYADKWADALKYYDLAVKANPRHRSSLTSKGMMLYNLGRYEDCIEVFDQCIELGHPIELEDRVYSYKATALLWLGRLREAYKYYNKAIKLCPSDPELYQYKAIVMFRGKKYDKALELINQSLSMNPTSQEALILKTMIEKANR
eukprot:gb/GECG01000400.1/.p1 GENE.gb/GECG01000400.1/~~gb/GECG01000400.1/.p1  ORF type:complete len:368 (+),score=59.99 gb/GECG01000400.1/:1-1104(+)